MSLRADGVLFDKDGTLFDFGATWNVWAADVINELAGGDVRQAERLAAATRFDLDRKTFHPDSPVIAGTGREAAECLAAALPERDVADIEAFLEQAAAQAPLVAAVPLLPLLQTLGALGLKLGVMTNDSELSAHAHLRAENVLQQFDFVAGFDSGFGAKPAPAPLWAFSDAVALTPERCVMVGDSTHDLIAGRAAGMQVVGVLTGPAPRDVLAPYADAVLPDIGHLTDWLQSG